MIPLTSLLFFPTVGFSLYWIMFFLLNYVLQLGKASPGDILKIAKNLPISQLFQEAFDAIRSAPSYTRLAICNNLTSIIQALITSAVGFAAIAGTKSLPLDNLIWMYIGYFPYNIACMFGIFIYQHPAKSFFHVHNAIILHDIGAMFFYLFILNAHSMSDFYKGCFLLMELCTPFVSIRLTLSELGLKETAVYFLTTVLMVVVFFIFRILVFPFVYFSYPSHIPIYASVGGVCMLLLELYWFSKTLQEVPKIEIKKAAL